MTDDAAFDALSNYKDALEDLNRLTKERRAANGQADDGTPTVLMPGDQELLDALQRERETYAAWEAERERVFGSTS